MIKLDRRKLLGFRLQSAGMNEQTRGAKIGKRPMFSAEQQASLIGAKIGKTPVIEGTDSVVLTHSLIGAKIGKAPG